MLLINLLFKNSNTILIKRHSSTLGATGTSSLDYCVNLVRKLDHDNFLCSVLLPEKIRATAFAIRAFNIELSKIQEQTNEKAAGIMRTKFWEDNIDNVYNNKPPHHPVLTELHKVIVKVKIIMAVKRHKLSKFHFKKLLTSRLNQLNVSTFKDMKDMEDYADNTCSPILMLLLEANEVRNVDCDHVASHIGRAQGLCNLIRSLPFNLKEKVVLLPRTELLKHSISEESLMRNSVEPEKLSQIIFEIASKANNHLKVANSLQKKVPDECKCVFLPAVPVRLFLNKLEKLNFYIYEPQLRVKNGLLPFHLIWSKFRNSYA